MNTFKFELNWEGLFANHVKDDNDLGRLGKERGFVY